VSVATLEAFVHNKTTVRIVPQGSIAMLLYRQGICSRQSSSHIVMHATKAPSYTLANRSDYDHSTDEGKAQSDDHMQPVQNHAKS